MSSLADRYEDYYDSRRSTPISGDDIRDEIGRDRSDLTLPGSDDSGGGGGFLGDVTSVGGEVVDFLTFQDMPVKNFVDNKLDPFESDLDDFNSSIFDQIRPGKAGPFSGLVKNLQGGIVLIVGLVALYVVGQLLTFEVG